MDAEFEARTLSQGDGRYIVALAGEIDMYTAPDVKRELAKAIDAGAHELTVDLSATTFIDSTMLGVLLGAQRRLRERDGRLRIISSDRNILQVFEITGLDRVFTITGQPPDP
jgi:anti-sigma B factor antagonist